MPEPPRLSLIDETDTQPIAAIRPVAGSGVAPAAQPARPAQPAARPARPVAQPVAYPAQPVAYPAQPVAYPAYPAQPVAHPAQPVAQPAQPVVRPAGSGRSRRGLGALLGVGGVVLLGIAAAGIFTPIVPRLMASPPAAAHSRASSRPSAASSSATPASSASPETLSAAGAALAAYVPPAFAGTCRSFTAAPMTGLVAAITCVPSGSGAPAHVEYYRYGSVTDLNAAFSHYAGGVSESGTCDQGGRRGTYAFAAGPIGGMWACYEDVNRTSQMIWTSTSLDILAAANDTGQTPQQLSNWFFSAAPTGPQ
jgi:hypothetical protein